MRRSLFILCVLALAGVMLAAVSVERAEPKKPAANVPAGYKLLYCQDFDKPAAIGDFEFSDAKQWKLVTADKGGALAFGGRGKYRPKVRSPLVTGLISGRVFEDFILEADLLQTGKEYGHRDMCLFFGLTGKSKFYYCHIATKADKNAHNIFIVNDKPRTNIATRTTRGVDWGKAKWHKVRLERKAADGAIRVFFDDMTRPIMEANDKTFKSGYVGFGSFDDSGRIDNVRIWAPKMQKTKSAFFTKKHPASRPSAARKP